MKYIGQYIKKICPGTVVTKSKSSESTYYRMSDDFSVRLSEHIGWFEREKVSIIKVFNSDDFIVFIGMSPFPLIKTRKEVKELIKTLYEEARLNALTKQYQMVKEQEKLEEITEWDKFWAKACQVTPNGCYLSNPQKAVIRKYFDEGIRGNRMMEIIKRIKPVMNVGNIEDVFKREVKK